MGGEGEEVGEEGEEGEEGGGGDVFVGRPAARPPSGGRLVGWIFLTWKVVIE